MALSQSYKKLRRPAPERETEALRLAPIFEDLWSRLTAGQLSEAELCGAQVLLFLASRRKGQPMARYKQASQAHQGLPIKDLVDGTNLGRLDVNLSIREFYETYELICIPLGIQRAIREWLRGQYPLHLRPSIPSPEEMLELQSVGRRCISVFIQAADLQALHSGKEAFEFLLHDLEHADKYFWSAELKTGQKQFFTELLTCWRQGLFNTLAATDQEFQRQLHYLMADMNSHPLHMIKYLKAVLLCHFLRNEGKSQNERLSAEGLRHLQNVNFSLISTFSNFN